MTLTFEQRNDLRRLAACGIDAVVVPRETIMPLLNALVAAELRIAKLEEALSREYEQRDEHRRRTHRLCLMNADLTVRLADADERVERVQAAIAAAAAGAQP